LTSPHAQAAVVVVAAAAANDDGGGGGGDDDDDDDENYDTKVFVSVHSQKQTDVIPVRR